MVRRCARRTWYNPAESGHGIMIHLLNATQAWMCWFTFDSAGNAAWICAVGAIDGDTITFAEAFVVEGGVFPPDFDPGQIEEVPWGSFTVQFTGSEKTGRLVMTRAAETLTPVSLELGGKDPMIVCADADLDNAVSGAVWGGFANAGQTCSGIERVYVLREVADRFIAGVHREAEAMAVGEPLEWGTEIGPMTSEGQYGIVVELIEDAVDSWATKLCGGPVDPPGLSGKFNAPTVLTGVTHEMRIMREEIFGPVLPIVVVDSEQEAIDLANDSEFGLGASVWTKDRLRGERIARKLESGMVWINDHSFSHGACQCSWGGVKDSGLGRSHSKFGFYECVNIKMNAWEPGLTRDFWWHPYDRTLGERVTPNHVDDCDGRKDEDCAVTTCSASAMCGANESCSRDASSMPSRRSKVAAVRCTSKMPEQVSKR